MLQSLTARGRKHLTHRKETSLRRQLGCRDLPLQLCQVADAVEVLHVGPAILACGGPHLRPPACSNLHPSNHDALAQSPQRRLQPTSAGCHPPCDRVTKPCLLRCTQPKCRKSLVTKPCHTKVQTTQVQTPAEPKQNDPSSPPGFTMQRGGYQNPCSEWQVCSPRQRPPDHPSCSRCCSPQAQ